MCILTPHWFDDAVRLGRRIPETPYAWPDPPVLRPGMTLHLDDDPLAIEGRRRRKPAAETGEGTDAPNDGEHVRVWAGRRVLLSTSLELADGSRRAIEVRIQRAGGVIVSISEDADEDVEERAVDECDVLVTRWRSGKSYFKVCTSEIMPHSQDLTFSSSRQHVHPFSLGLSLGCSASSLVVRSTPPWTRCSGIPLQGEASPISLIVFVTVQTSTTVPSVLIGALQEISITNYTGAARDYLKRLITLVGAKFTPSMSQSNKVLVAGL